jgi:alkylation response protein AidB-like acyl-CoA dehydrogenase
MSDFAGYDVASLRAAGAARLVGFLRGVVRAALRHARDRRAARAAERDLYLSDQKLTDEMERKMIAHLTRNRGFRL